MCVKILPLTLTIRTIKNIQQEEKFSEKVSDIINSYDTGIDKMPIKPVDLWGRLWAVIFQKYSSICFSMSIVLYFSINMVLYMHFLFLVVFLITFSYI